ncbi:MAG: sugar ABC transporter ATP-binding protein [Chloroflexi bacterium]|nr:sugar ABC transporter ATP-binding protein [Chloroflexota bacterium]
MTHFLELRGITKSFGEVQSLRHVDMYVDRAEVIGLLGDNGAGKSTLIKIITGYHRPDSGQILFNNRPVENLTVPKARQLGIETVYQERALADQQSLWRNIFIGRELTNRFGMMDIKRMREETQRLMQHHMGFTSSAVTPDSPVQTFSGGEKQGVAIVRALYFQAELIILDEPTMGLALSETGKLLEFVEQVRAAGKSVIFIDHNIFHVYEVADRIVLLDRGRVAGEFRTSDLSLNELLDKMRRVAKTGSLD